MNKFTTLSLICVGGLMAITWGSDAHAIMKRIDQTITFGPVQLHEGARLELCANARFSEDAVQTVFGFVRVSDGAAVLEEIELVPGEGRCFSLDFGKVGEAPVFGVVGVNGDAQLLDLVTSAAVINGIFEAPKPKVTIEDQGQSTSTTFGPLVIPEGKRFKTCAHNGASEYPTETRIRVFGGKSSVEPLISQEYNLEPDQGGCFTLTAEQARGRAVMVEVLTDPVEPGFSNPVPVIGAFIINGVFESPLPGDFRFLPSEE